MKWRTLALLGALIVNIVIIAAAYQAFAGSGPSVSPAGDCPRFIVCNNRTGDTDDWNRIRLGVDAAAEEYGAAVEYVECAFTGDCADTDTLRMAVESKVDGIAILPTSEDISQALIFADTRKIPVVTMVADEPGSASDHFIGVDESDYERQLIRMIGQVDSVGHVGLIRSKNHDGGTRASALDAALATRYRLTVVDRSSSYIFDASENLKELILSDSNLELVCCLDNNTTLGVAQAIVNWNMVKRIAVVGTGDSPEILAMIQKGIIRATLVIDYEEIGYQAVKALYFAAAGGKTAMDTAKIPIRMITQENVKQYQK